MKKKTDKPKLGPEQTSSPGFLIREKKLVFEQIEHGAYAIYNIEKGTLLFKESGVITDYYDEDNDVQYLPLRRVPWPLTTPKITFTLGEEPELWKDVAQFVYEHLDVVEPELYDVLTAWVFATYIPEIWRVVPYIFFYGPVATGKTRGLETLQSLVYRGFLGSNISSAALFRSCDKWHPTVCLDETEIYSSADHIEVIGLLNAGYRKGQFALRVKNTDQGQELEAFDVFGFKALSGTEGLAKTLESRSIKVRMIRNTRPIKFLVDLQRAAELRGKLLMWRFLKLHQLLGEGCEGCEGCEPYSEVPPELNFTNGRLIELFQPLIMVANEGSENIVKYAKKVYEIRQLEEETSVEAMILNALLDSESKVEDRVILTKDIRETLNLDIPKKEHFKTTTVGKIMGRLGFLPKHTRRGNGWVWNDSRVKLLKMRYLPGDISPELPSQPSQPSQPSPTPLSLVKTAERCEACGKFPVAYEFTYEGKKIRRCRNCIDKMSEKGFKFTFTEIDKS